MINEEGKYEIDTSGDEFKAIDTNRTNDLAYVDNVYGSYDEKTGNFTGGLGQQIDTVTNQQIANVQDYANKQSAIQQEQTNHTINQINQQKEQSGKDYIQEGSAAYVDYQKATNAYGVNAEKMAESGMIGGGYSESSKVAMYTTYQNRVASARKVYSDAILNYNNAIKDAQIANSAALAEIAFNSQQAQLELAMNAINKKGELVDKIVSQKNAINSRYDTLWQNAIQNQYSYDTLNESSRQWQAEFDEGNKQWQATFDEGVRQFEQGQKNWESEFAWQKETDQRDYDRAVAESDRDYSRGVIESDREFAEKQRVNNASIKSDAFNRVMDLISSGASASITEDMLKEAGISSGTVKEIVSAQNALKESSKSETQFAARMTLVDKIVNNGYVPTKEDYEIAGLTDEASKAEFQEYIDAVAKSADIDLGGDDGGTVVGSGVTKANWTTVTNYLGGTPDEKTLQALTDAGILSITEAGGSHIGTISDKAGLDYIVSAINNGHTADEAIAYFKKPLADRLGDMTLEYDGGHNGRLLWEKDVDNLNRNAKVKDKMGNVWTIDELFGALKKSGVSADTAKNKLLELQKNVGITKDHGEGWDWWNDLWD